jgi:hypothetical protein
MYIYISIYIYSNYIKEIVGKEEYKVIIRCGYIRKVEGRRAFVGYSYLI